MVLFRILAILLVAVPLGAQVSVNTDGATPDSSAILDLTSTQMGMLLPRMEQSERLSIPSPAGGLWLFETGAAEKGFYYNAGNTSSPEWVRMTAIINGTVARCDRRIPVDSVQFSDGTIEITEPGSYYLTENVSITRVNRDGITINADNVTLDLNGYTLDGSLGGVATDDGIVVLGDQDNIFIKNGIIKNWGGDGINAFNCDNCSFADLIIDNNGGDGLVTDFGGIIYNCTARGNGIDGLEGDDNSIIYNCTASDNGDNGIQSSGGTQVFNCTSINNESDGIDVGSGSRVEGCTVSGNEVFGIDIALGGQVFNCVANNNGRHGIDASSTCLVKFNTANNNGACVVNGTCSINQLNTGSVGAGIRTFANSQITNNVCRGNYYGIRISSTDSFVSDNIVTDNSHAGLTLSSSGSFAIRNRARNNGFDPVFTANSGPGNYSFVANASFGPIVDLTAISGSIISVTNSDHYFANFIY